MSKVRRDYARYHIKTCGNNISIEDQGIILSQKYPFLCASVDGTVSCTKCGNGIVEIKCPYIRPNRTQEECASEDDIC